MEPKSKTDGTYTYYSVGQDGNPVAKGRFLIRNDEIVYSDDKFERAMSEDFPPGPLSEHTEIHISKLLHGGNGYSYLVHTP